MTKSRHAIGALAFAAAIIALAAPAEAQIGLSHAKKGGAYLSIEGGYQNRDGANSIAPQPGGSNPFGSGVSVQERAFASPDGAEASSSASQGGSNASANGRAEQGSSAATAVTNQTEGGATTSSLGQGFATVNGEASAASLASSGITGAAPGGNAAGANLMITPAVTAAGSQTGTGAGQATANAAGPGVVLPADAAAASASGSGGAGVGSVAVGGGVAATNSGIGGPATAAGAAAGGVISDNGVASAAVAGGDRTQFSASSAAEVGGAGSGGASAAFDRTTGTATALTANGSAALDQIDAEHGAFGGVSVGYAFAQRLFGAIDRIEAYGTFSNNEETDQTSGFSFSATSADGRVALAIFDSNGIGGSHELSDKQREFGLRFKSDNFTDTAFPLIVSFEPFYRQHDLDARASVGADYALDSEVEARLYGAQLALETETPVLFPGLSFVGRASAGVYVIDVDGRFSERIGSYTLANSASDDETGFRLGGEAGLRLQMNETSFVTVSGAVDHLSEAPAAGFGGAKSFGAPFELDETTDYQAKLDLTFRSND